MKNFEFAKFKLEVVLRDPTVLDTQMFSDLTAWARRIFRNFPLASRLQSEQILSVFLKYHLSLAIN